MTKINLERLAELCAKATPGPWVSQDQNKCTGWPIAFIGESRKSNLPYVVGTPPRHISDAALADSNNDADYIAACDPGTIQALIDDSRRMAEALKVYAKDREIRDPDISGGGMIITKVQCTPHVAREAIRLHEERFE